jgi:hypothetical protein
MAKLKPVQILGGSGLASFKATHDPKVVIPNKIQATLDLMAKANTESWLAEEDFLKQAGVSKEEIRVNREAFDEHIVEVKRKNRGTPARFWFADVKVAAKARS